MNSANEESIFEAALGLPPEERAAYLQKACGVDIELRQRVEALLQAHEAAGYFMTDPAASPARNASVGMRNGGCPEPGTTVRDIAPLTEKPGDKIGHYKLLQQIGEGGCGVVYMAEQEEPIHRRVAFKVIKLGMDTRQVIARFEAERQALALMDHPNIAKVLDAGATDTGPALLRDGVGAGHSDYRVLRPEQALDARAAGPVHPGLPRHPARAPERDHSPGHQAVEHPGDACTTVCRCPR